MTNDITLFEEGLVKSSEKSAQPELDAKFLHKIEKRWDASEAKRRSRLAIKHMAQYIPAFDSAQVTPKPLYGAQQIPGRDASLRAADVSFEEERYARCEIVKASSVLTMADAITKQLIALGYVDKSLYGKRDFDTLRTVNETQLREHAESLCLAREYPVALTQRTMADYHACAINAKSLAS